MKSRFIRFKRQRNPFHFVTVALAEFGYTVAFFVIEAAGIEAFNDTVIETRAKERNAGKSAQVFELHLTVSDDAFIIGKEIRDILWPPTCAVLSVEKAKNAPLGSGFSPGDVIHVHYKTYYPISTFAELESLVGVQDCDSALHSEGYGICHFFRFLGKYEGLDRLFGTGQIKVDCITAYRHLDKSVYHNCKLFRKSQRLTGVFI